MARFAPARPGPSWSAAEQWDLVGDLFDPPGRRGAPARISRRQKAVGVGRAKNDAIDAATLAHLSRTNLLPGAWIAPPPVRELRRLVRMRSSLVRIRSRLKCQVHAICADAGVPVPASVRGNPRFSTGRFAGLPDAAEAAAIRVWMTDRHDVIAVKPHSEACSSRHRGGEPRRFCAGVLSRATRKRRHLS